MRPFTIDVDPANANLTGFASNVTGATFTLTGSSSGDGLAHQVSIKNDSATDHSGKTVTLVGTDADGRALTEVVTAPGSSATVESTGYFLTLTSATPSATIGADTFDIGWVDECVTPTHPLDVYASEPLAVVAKVTGTCAFDIEVTNSDVQGTTAPVFANDANWTNKSADLAAALSATGWRGMRVVLNSYTDTAEVQFYCSQPVGA